MSATESGAAAREPESVRDIRARVLGAPRAAEEPRQRDSWDSAQPWTCAHCGTENGAIWPDCVKCGRLRRRSMQGNTGTGNDAPPERKQAAAEKSEPPKVPSEQQSDEVSRSAAPARTTPARTSTDATILRDLRTVRDFWHARHGSGVDMDRILARVAESQSQPDALLRRAAEGVLKWAEKQERCPSCQVRGEGDHDYTCPLAELRDVLIDELATPAIAAWNRRASLPAQPAPTLRWHEHWYARWHESAVWLKLNHWYICHATDGDNCFGPFMTEEEAEHTLAVLRSQPAAQSQPDAPPPRTQP